jgi:energy-coupling factor transport system substrate-specific component
MKNEFSTTYLTRSLILVFGGMIVYIGIGELVRNVLQLPIFLVSIGTILVGALLGSLAGAATGANILQAATIQGFISNP